MRSFLHNCRVIIIRIVDSLYFPFLRRIPLEVFRYGVTGGANTIFDIFLYFIFYNYLLKKQILHLGFVAISPHIAAFLLVFPITFTTGFILAKYVTFTASELGGRVQLLRYGLIVLTSILLNYIFLKLFVEYVGLDAVLSKVLTTVIVVIFSYVSQRYFSFKTAAISKQTRS